MQVRIPEAQMARLHAHLEAAYPDEGAGFLLGHLQGEAFLVGGILTLENRWQGSSQRNRFRLEPQDALQAELAAARQGMDVIGVFHSHPDHPAQPSQWDLAWATWPNFAYLITSVEQGQARRTRAWRLREDRSAFEEDTLTLVNGTSRGGK